MKGTLSEIPLAEVVRDLHFDRADGVLAVSSRGQRSEVYFDRGSVFYCKSDSPEQKLERILVRWGLVSEAQVASLVQRAGRDVRGTLVRDGVFASERDFDDFMAQILRERVMELFALETGDWEFTAKDVRAMRQLPFPSTTPNVVLEGVRRMASPDTFGALLLEDDPALAPNERPAVPLQSLQMGPAEGYVISLVNGTARLGEITRVSPLGPDGTVRLLYGLLLLDVVRHPGFIGVRFAMANLVRRNSELEQRERAEHEAIEAEYQRARGVDLFQLLPGGPTMGPGDLRAAVKEYQERWTPERFSPRIARSMRDQLMLIGGRAGELLLAAMDAERKQRAVDTDAPDSGGEGDDGLRLKRMEFSKSRGQEKKDADAFAAQAHFTRACDAFRAKDFHSAIQFVREAIRLNETAEYQALLADALVMNPHWGKKAEEAYMRAMQLDPYDVGLPLSLGRIYMKAGLKQRAREMFEKALGIHPENEDAKQALKDAKKM